jgi:hypothetical protein
VTRSDFDPDLERLGDALRASITLDLAREEQAAPATGASRARQARPRRRLLAGGTLGLAGVGVALVLALGGSTASPAFAITRGGDGSVLVKLNYGTNQNLPQVNAKLASMGLHEGITIYMAPGAASVSRPVTCAQGPGATTPVKVLVGTNGTETIAPGQSGGNTAEGSFHLDHCVVTGDNEAGNAGG